MNPFALATDPIEVRAANELLDLPRTGAGPGLHRMSHLLERVHAREWVSSLRAIKVTGSKGKGSTSALAAAILQNLGLRVGSYTSPHLFRFVERIRIDGTPVSGAELQRSSERMLAARAEYEARHPADRFGGFEMFTGVGLDCFAARHVDTLVAEAGLGGRYDATRVIPGDVVALTSLELEHTAILGHSLELIAYDKSDLCPTGGVLIVGPIDEEALRKLRAYSKLRSVEAVSIADVASVSPPRFDADAMYFSLSCSDVDLGEVRCNLLGEHQAWNAAVAVVAVQSWLSRRGRKVATEHLRRAVSTALRSVDCPGRFHRVALDPTIVIDVGHTPLSARATAETVKRVHRGEPVLLVTGVSVDKDAAGILRELVPVADAVVCTRAHHKGAPVTSVRAICEALRPGCVWRAAETVEQAVDAARARAHSDSMIVVVAGGLFLAAEAAAHVAGLNPRSLRFF